MKRQTRPFAVEIKNARNLATTERASFSREAEAMFNKASNPAPQPEASTLLVPTQNQPRVLPDLRQVATADAPALMLKRRPRKPLKPKQLRKQSQQDGKVP